MNRDATKSDKIVFGVCEKDASLVEYNLTKMPHYMVISDKKSSDANEIMKGIIKEFQKKLDAKVVLYDNGTNQLAPLKGERCQYISSVAEFDEFFEQLNGEMDKRIESMKLCNYDFEPIVIAIQGYKKMYEDITDDSAKKLSRIIEGSTALNIYLLALDYPENLGELRTKEYVMRSMLRTGPVLFVGGDYFSHLDIPGDEDYTAGRQTLEEMEAYLLFDGKAERFKAIK